MKKAKRSLSALLAVVMVFTMMAVAFTMTGSAAPTVLRIPSTRLSPTVEFSVPAIIETWGTDIYSAGSNVRAIGEIQATITTHVAGAPVEDISLLCSDAGIQLSPRQIQGEGGSYWSVQGGVLKTAPADDGSTMVKWTLSYTIDGKGYASYAWSQVQPNYNNPGFAVKVRHKYPTAAHTSYNHHVEWIQPVLGDPASDTADNYSQVYVHEGDGQHYAATTVNAASYYWDWHQGDGWSYDNETHTSALTAKGTIYVDVSQKQNLSTVGMASRAKPHKELEDPDNHPQYYEWTKITRQSINGNTSTAFSVNSPGETRVYPGGETGASFSGQLPAANGTARIDVEIEWQGQITRTLGVTAKSYHNTICKYQIDIVTYDKTALLAKINALTAANYQASHFRNSAPAGNNNVAFRTWDEYIAALQTAWFIYGRVDVTQTQINDALADLNDAEPKYNANTGAWSSGMMYADADYSQINTIKGTIADTLEPDFYVDYSDGMHGVYYQYSLATALNEALEDIAYDEPLDARYQATVDQMRINLTNAINGLVETSQRKTTKLVTLEFDPNTTGVSGMPAAVTTSLTGQFTRPTTDPTKSYYSFVNWYYDAACTVPVTWPIYINPNSTYFKANLNEKVDNLGVAYTIYAGWRVTGKSLTFDTQGGTPIEPYVGAEGTPYGGPTVSPTKTGCRFIGWYTDTTFETPVDWDTFTLGSLSVVYARWAENSFTVTFNAVGGKFADGSPSYSVTALYSTPIQEPIPPTKANCGFNGWYYDSECTDPVDILNFTIPDENIQVYANWDTSVRTLVLDPQNGDPLFVQTYDVGTSIKSSFVPAYSKEGFNLDGWYRNPEGMGSERSFPFSLTSSTTLYAKWVGYPVTVEFDPNGGEMSEDFDPSEYEDLEGGSELIFPDDPTMPEYVFDGWTLNGEPYTSNLVPAATDETDTFTLVASWKEEPYVATLRLRTDAGDSVEQGDVITATVSMTANRYVANHRFVVYYDKRYLQPALNGQPVTSNITGTSACSKIAGRAYFTLVRNTGGHNVTDCGTPTGRVTPGNIASAYQFFPEEWVKDARTLKDDYKNYEFVYFDAPDIASGTRSRPSAEQDLVSFQFLVRSDAPIADGVTSYAQLLLSEDFVRTPEQTTGNRTAVCLQGDAAYTNVKDWDNTTTLVVDGDQRFAVTQMQACLINFITNGGAALDSIENAKQGSTITLPTPTRDYYYFSGWTWTNDASDTDYVNAEAFEVPYANSITLYAKWTGKSVTYYVRHHKQNMDASGFLETYEQVQARGTVGTTVTATPKNYDGFICENPNASGVVRGESSNPLIIDLWYLRKTTKITLNANGGRFQNGQQTVVLSGLYDTAVTNVPENPTREGYLFSDWEQGTTVYTINKYPADDINLDAQWTAKTITLRFYLNGASSPYQTLVGQYGDEIEVPSVTVNDGEVFSGWKNSSGVAFNYTTFPANDEDFYGSVGLDGHYLTLFIGGTQYGEPIEVRTGTQVTEASIGYTPAPGYRFTGWRTENSRDGARAVFPMTLTADTSLYGFTERETYSVTTIIYVDGEPEDGPSIDSIFYGQPFDLPEPEDYTDMGYGFRGWFTDPQMTTPFEKPATMPAENIVLYGEYYEMTGTLVFDLNGGTGTAPANITKPLGARVTSLPDDTGFSNKYYKFSGWSTSLSGIPVITSYSFDTEEVVTLYAIWKDNFATVYFNLNGAQTGTTPSSMRLEVGEAVTAANMPSAETYGITRNGYIFSGWSDKANARAGLESYTPTSTGDKTLFAVWVADKVELIAREGSTTVIDKERGFIYGLEFNVTADKLMNDYLDVLGNGHLSIESPQIGTGTVVQVINDYSGNVDETYRLIIFGDVNGDGAIGPDDVTKVRTLAARLGDDESAWSLDNPYAYAANVFVDEQVNQTDVGIIRALAARVNGIDQVTRETYVLT